MVAETAWPQYDAALTRADQVVMAVQVNGKRRGEITLDTNADAKVAEAQALALEGVIRALDGKAPKKVIVVPNRIVNVVV
jgi:leucyl-tRNA synthetase